MNLIAGCFLFVVIWVNLDNIFSLMPSRTPAGVTFLFLGLGWVVNMYVGSRQHDSDDFKTPLWFMLSILLVGLTVTTSALMIPRDERGGVATMISLLVFNVGHVAFRINSTEGFSVVARCPRRL